MSAWLSASWRRFLTWANATDPLRLVVLGYLSYTLLGWATLCLPVCRQSGTATALDHLFTATSAVSTTGLVTLSTADTYSPLGESVILLLIQVGGLGYMTIGSFVLMAISRGQLSPLRERIGGTALALPPGFNVRGFLRLIVTYTFAVEAVGALVLYYAVFAPRGVPAPVWQSVFHSVSAFSTAGFGLFNDSFESYRGDVALNVTIIVLSLLGAIGFLVVNDAWQSLVHRGVRVTLTTRIILVSTTAIITVGTVLFFFDEPAIRSLPAGERWLASFFQVMTASTTVGFDTVPIASLSAGSLFLLMLVMMIGASPAGTGGGIKTTTFTALWAVMLGVFRRRDRVTFLGREIPEARIRTAIASMLFYCLTLAAGTYALALFERAALAEELFECVSALGTVGLSCGLTGQLGTAGKIIIIVLMFVGRAGPAVLGMAFFQASSQPPAAVPPEDVVT